jgi:hypothetical protein
MDGEIEAVPKARRRQRAIPCIGKLNRRLKNCSQKLVIGNNDGFKIPRAIPCKFWKRQGEIRQPIMQRLKVNAKNRLLHSRFETFKFQANSSPKPLNRKKAGFNCALNYGNVQTFNISQEQSVCTALRPAWWTTFDPETATRGLSCASGPQEVHLDSGSAVHVLQPKCIFLSVRDGGEPGCLSVETLIFFQ